MDGYSQDMDTVNKFNSFKYVEFYTWPQNVWGWSMNRRIENTILQGYGDSIITAWKWDINDCMTEPFTKDILGL